MKSIRALESIQNMIDHLQKWHDGSSNRRTSSSSSDGIDTITSKIDSLGRDMKKLKENVHVIQVGCGLCGGTHIDKECLLNKEVKEVEEVKYGEFRGFFPNNGRNKSRYRVGPLRYYTRMENLLPFGEKKPSLEDLINKHIEESTRRRNETEDWMKRLRENISMNIRNQNATLKNLETPIKQLTNDFHAKATKEAPNSYTPIGQCKAIFADNNAQSVGTCSNETNKVHGVSFIFDCDMQISKMENEGSLGVLACQLPPKEINPRSFTLPCTIGSLNMYVLVPRNVI
ncbi:hypothetical protein Tco_0801771 [Tanacetum coccineum]|uniref:Uncharacterized protein n=1 Tax=Tanacetum coccineum TaxID=301880 RepID=A0ABQ5A176_9ASTR